jgi:hypothetical protein
MRKGRLVSAFSVFVTLTLLASPCTAQDRYGRGPTSDPTSGYALKGVLVVALIGLRVLSRLTRS